MRARWSGVIAFMSLQDVDEPERAIAEVARVLRRGGLLCLAITHPLNSAGRFTSEDPDSPFVIDRSYLDSWRREEDVARDGLEIRFHYEHRPLDRYARALEDAGFLIERIREMTGGSEILGSRWDRIQLFLHLRARMPGNRETSAVV